ncbi:MAG TPA: hypothetical protein VFN11_01900 [Ktedonobacterales bacterium]|nr:hypothetical protein [Ktedonobacterales bacterium]
MKRLVFTVVSIISLVVIVFAFVLTRPAHASVASIGGSVGSGGGTPGTSSNFTLVGHDPLFNRGMNAALAIFDHFVYVGNRTDGSSTCNGGGTTCPHPHPGVLIVDVSNPASPQDVGEIGPPFEGNVGITSRELRVWPQKKLLMVMNFRCSSVIHVCPPGNDTTFPFDIKFYDLTDPVHPAFLTSYVPTSRAGLKVKPHEMFLWVDPNNPDRALLYLSTPTLSVNPARPNLLIADISAVPSGGSVSEVAEGNWNDQYPGASNPANYNFNLFVHSMGLTADGTRAYLAMEAGEFLVLDTSAVANNVPNPQLRLVTDPANRPIWGNPAPCTKVCPNGHSAVQVPGRPLALTTDEIYGTFTDPSFGCPWGWMRLIDVNDPTHPQIVGEYKIAQDDQAFCGSSGDDPLTEQFTSYSSHNPTVLPNLAFIAWHSGGLQAVDIANARQPSQAGWFSPTPLDTVATEDPALNGGPNKVTMWSYPIISNGLIYVIDIRNGLYILRYTGPHHGEVDAINFLEGNSNLGDALTLGENDG